MKIINDVEIEDYKGIEKINFPCNSINIVVGPNNTGKSSILESIWATLSSLNEYSDILDTSFNFILNEDSFRYLMHKKETKSKIRLNLSKNENLELNLVYSEKNYPIEIAEFFENFLLSFKEVIDYDSLEPGTKDSEYRLYRLLREVRKNDRLKIDDSKISFILNDIADKIESKRERFRKDFTSAEKLFLISKLNEKLISVFFKVEILDDRDPISIYQEELKVLHTIPFMISSPKVDEDVSLLYKKLVNTKKLENVLVLLRNRISYFEDIREVNGKLFVLLKNIDNPLPLSFMGDGFKALLKLAFLAPLVNNGIVIFEEPEVSMHPGYLEILADEIISNSENSQFFISTHSLELINYLLEKADKMNKINDVNIIKLRRLNKGEIDRQILSGRQSKQKIEEIQIDLRGY